MKSTARKRSLVPALLVLTLFGLTCTAPGCGSKSDDTSGDSNGAPLGGAGGARSDGGGSGFSSDNYKAQSEKPHSPESIAPGVPRTPRDFGDTTPPAQTCEPGTRACRCTDNHTCDEGMNCLADVCGAVSRWGPWTEEAVWPEVQALHWGGDDGMGGASNNPGVWE